jgi:molybdopterin-guanine dinucleotide biosynthesis protein A
LAEESSKLKIIMKTDFAGFILVGGKSSRMGKDKFLLKINGKTFLQTAFETLEKAGVEQISVSVSEKTNLIEDFPIIEDIYKNRGALSGIHSALVYSKSSFSIILACDYPFVSVELIEFLMNMAIIENEFDAFAPIQADGKIQPLCAVYKTGICCEILSKMLENQDENYSVRDFLNRVKTRYIEFNEIKHLPNSEKFFFNVNTPEDFGRAKNIDREIH